MAGAVVLDEEGNRSSAEVEQHTNEPIVVGG